MRKLNEFRSSPIDHDWVRWLGSNDGSFTVRSLRSLTRGLIPPNYLEVFCLELGLASSWPRDPSLFLEARAALVYPIGQNDLVFNIKPMDWINLNFLVKWRQRGMGGVLRGSNGEILFQFSESCSSSPPSVLEFLAIRIEVSKFLDSRWYGQLRLIIESDYKLVTDWLSLSVVPPANLDR
ncbi:hypothetical protein GQ457_05G019350 [Hibiscus cannabinus]